VIGRTVSSLQPDRKSVLQELGLAGLQVWQSLSEAAGRGRGTQELAVMFTDLAGFSSWALEAQAEVGEIEIDGYRPSMRVGVHWGCPRKLGGDYLGVDVNIAARVGDAAKPGQVLVSDALLARIDAGGLSTGRAKRLRADGRRVTCTSCGSVAADAPQTPAAFRACQRAVMLGTWWLLRCSPAG
jgi:adenylate cyclase